jgi:hypothetical protein
MLSLCAGSDELQDDRSRQRLILPDRLGANPAYRDVVGFPGNNMGPYQCGQVPAQSVCIAKLYQIYTRVIKISANQARSNEFE